LSSDAFSSNSLPAFRIAFEMLHLVMVPILKNARILAENEHGNYIVQFVLRMDYLSLQRQHVIINAIL